MRRGMLVYCCGNGDWCSHQGKLSLYCLYKNKITSPRTFIAGRRGRWHSSFCAEIIPKGRRVLGTVPRYSPSGKLSGDQRAHTESCLVWSSRQKVILSASSQRHSSSGRYRLMPFVLTSYEHQPDE